MAGLGHRGCEGVLALTNDDDANLAVVMAAIAAAGRICPCSDAARQHPDPDGTLRPGSAINADDRFGDYLCRSTGPVSHQLLRWLMDSDQE